MLETSAACDLVVGSRIRLRRKQRGFSQERLAAILGVSSHEVADFESGTTRVGAERLATIGAVLEAPISYFFAELGAVAAGPDDPPANSAPPAPGTGELVSAYCRIASSQLRGAVLSFARILARGRGTRRVRRLGRNRQRVAVRDRVLINLREAAAILDGVGDGAEEHRRRRMNRLYVGGEIEDFLPSPRRARARDLLQLAQSTSFPPQWPPPNIQPRRAWPKRDRSAETSAAGPV